jgi:U32 family peptidase
MRVPELLAPAGNLRNLRYALAYGADAVYAGQPRYSLRVRNNDFDKLANLAEGIALTHAAGKQFYLAVNLLPHNAKLKTFCADLAPIAALKPDALIMADPGLILLVREQWPELPIHLSVQANTMNWAAVRFWQQQGIRRVILSRELSLEEIAEIRQHCPDMELEVFVHGALCIAYSGRCLLSGYFNHRDPNQGSCTNACRWNYQLHPASEDASGDVQIYAGLLEESQRPGEYMPVFEDEHGTYIMNSKDLRAVQHVARLAEIGVNSIKIEGRTKSHYYTARTAQVYRRALDAAAADQAFDPSLLSALNGLANRGYTEGFYRRHTHDATQNYGQGVSQNDSQLFVGEALGYVDGLLEIEVKNRINRGDSVELMTPYGNHMFCVDILKNSAGEDIDCAPGSGHIVYLGVPPGLAADYALLIKNLSLT